MSLIGWLCLINAAQAQIASAGISATTNSSSQPSELSTLEHQVTLLEARLAKLREVEEANAWPSPVWGWLLGFSLCVALLCVAWMLWMLHRLQKQQRKHTQVGKIFAPESSLGVASSAKLIAIPPQHSPVRMSATTPAKKIQAHNPFADDPDDLHVLEFEAQALNDDEYDFAIGLGQPATWGNSPHANLRPLKAPQKHLADVDLMEDDLQFFSPVSTGSSENFFQVEEISDGLQQAKFWATLHKLEHAVAILEEEISLGQISSPASWIYLLDLYSKIDEKEKYKLLRERFHRFFNGQIPAWREAEPEHKLGLADFPHITAKLARILQSEQAIPYLESLLLDDRQGSRQGFAYGVYCDLVQLLENVKQGRRTMIFS